MGEKIIYLSGKKIGESRLVGILGILVIALLFMTGGGFQQGNAINATDNATIMVTINTKTMVDISPENMSFGTLDPGSRSINYTNDELISASKTAFQLENIGSTNLTNLWLNVTQPTIRPFATGIANNYDAANFVTVEINQSPDGSAITQNALSFVDRIEYNETRELVYLNVPATTKSYGRLRSGYNEYFWALYGTKTQCNASSAGTLYLRIGLSPHNQTQTGTIDLVGGAEGTDWETITLGAMYDSGFNENWSYSSVVGNTIPIDTPATEYCATAYIDCSKVRFFRWNADAPGAGTCGLAGNGYIYNSTNTELMPGDSIAMNIEMRVPFGTVMGDIKTGYLTVIGQSSETS
ncbi:MAG: hypothetical protein V1718_03945 [archaeon]